MLTLTLIVLQLLQYFNQSWYCNFFFGIERGRKPKLIFDKTETNHNNTTMKQCLDNWRTFAIWIFRKITQTTLITICKMFVITTTSNRPKTSLNFITYIAHNSWNVHLLELALAIKSFIWYLLPHLNSVHFQHGI